MVYFEFFGCFRNLGFFFQYFLFTCLLLVVIFFFSLWRFCKCNNFNVGSVFGRIFEYLVRVLRLFFMGKGYVFGGLGVYLVNICLFVFLSIVEDAFLFCFFWVLVVFRVDEVVRVSEVYGKIWCCYGYFEMREKFRVSFKRIFFVEIIFFFVK